MNVEAKNDNYKRERDRLFSPVYNLILKNTESKGSILDIGAGTGIFLTKFKEIGWDIKGVEFSDKAVAYSKKKYNINLINGDVLGNKKISIKARYSVITMNNVLEHLYEPLETLKFCNKLLKKDGILVIVVPNIDSLGYKIFKKNWYPLQPPIHLYQFTPSTIRDMLEKSGFKVIKVKHFYMKHSFFSLFESFRFLFKKKDFYPLLSTSTNYAQPDVNILKLLGKYFGIIFAFFFSLIGSSLGRGETIIVYARKN